MSVTLSDAVRRYDERPRDGFAVHSEETVTVVLRAPRRRTLGPSRGVAAGVLVVEGAAGQVVTTLSVEALENLGHQALRLAADAVRWAGKGGGE